MKPLTLDCARVCQHLDALHDGELDEAERAFVEAHLAGCSDCLGSWTDMQRAITALRALAPEDIERLRTPLTQTDLVGVDQRPLSRLLIVVSVLGIIALGLGVYFTFRTPPSESSAPTAPLASAAPAPAFVLPAIGVELGVEVEAEIEEPYEEPLPIKADPEPPEPPIEPERPPPIIVAVPKKPKPEPPRAAPKPAVKKPKPKPRVVKKPLPDATKRVLERLQLAKGGLQYRDLVLFFVRDPDETERLGSRRAHTDLPRTAESSPRNPEKLVVRPRRSSRHNFALQGELFDGPLGLRILPHTRRVSSRTELDVVPVMWDALKRRKPNPLLKGPVLLPSYARRALIAKQQPGAVALFLQALTEPTLGELPRLREDLSRIEHEAKELERRLRARIGSVRGLVGLAIRIGDTPRNVDLFGSPRLLSAGLPKLIRAALLEARIKKPLAPDDVGADYRTSRILGGIKQGRKQLTTLIASLGDAWKAELPKGRGRRAITAYYRAGDVKKDGAGALYLEGERIVHAVFCAK